jgi:hypothetical protein
MRRLVLVLASFFAVSFVPVDATAQRRDPDEWEREDRQRDRERRERDRRARERERREREHDERQARVRVERDRHDRVSVRVFRQRYRDPVPARSLTLAVGVLNYDFAGDDDENFPMAALRADWRLTRFLRGEVDGTYAVGDVADPTAADGDRSTSLATATAGVRAELPLRYLRPYVGAAVGLFGRFDGGDDGESFVRPTTAFPVGLRLAVSPRLALRAEVRFRFDQHENEATAVNREQTVGLSFGF